MYYFAYGSNMNQERMKSRNTGFVTMQKACLENYCLRFNKISSKTAGEGVANIIGQSGCVVEGVLYKIDNECITNLDRYENCPAEYRRELLDVNGYGSEIFKAQVYIANQTHVSENLLPSRHYL